MAQTTTTGLWKNGEFESPRPASKSSTAGKPLDVVRNRMETNVPQLSGIPEEGLKTSLPSASFQDNLSFEFPRLATSSTARKPLEFVRNSTDTNVPQQSGTSEHSTQTSLPSTRWWKKRSFESLRPAGKSSAAGKPLDAVSGSPATNVQQKSDAQERIRYLSADESKATQEAHAKFIQKVMTGLRPRNHKKTSSRRDVHDDLATLSAKKDGENKAKFHAMNEINIVDSLSLGREIIHHDLILSHPRFQKLFTAVMQGDGLEVKKNIQHIRTDMQVSKPVASMSKQRNITFHAIEARVPGSDDTQNTVVTRDTVVTKNLKDLTYGWKDTTTGNYVLSTSAKGSLTEAQADYERSILLPDSRSEAQVDTKTSAYTVDPKTMLHFHEGTMMAVADIDFEATLKPNRFPENPSEIKVIYHNEGYEIDLKVLDSIGNAERNTEREGVRDSFQERMKEQLHSLEQAVETGKSEFLIGQMQKIAREDMAAIYLVRTVRKQVRGAKEDEQIFFSERFLGTLKRLNTSEILAMTLKDPKVLQQIHAYTDSIETIKDEALQDGVSEQDFRAAWQQVISRQNPLGLESLPDEKMMKKAEQLANQWADPASIDTHLNKLYSDPLQKLAIPLAMPAEFMPHIESIQFAPGAKPVQATRLENAFEQLGRPPQAQASYVEKLKYIYRFEMILQGRTNVFDENKLEQHFQTEPVHYSQERLLQQSMFENLLHERDLHERISDGEAIPMPSSLASTADKFAFVQRYKDTAAKGVTATSRIAEPGTPFATETGRTAKLERILRIENILNDRNEDHRVGELRHLRYPAANATPLDRLKYTLHVEYLLHDRDVSTIDDRLRNLGAIPGDNQPAGERLAYFYKVHNLYHDQGPTYGLQRTGENEHMFHSELFADRFDLQKLCSDISTGRDLSTLNEKVQNLVERAETPVPPDATPLDKVRLALNNVTIRDHNAKVKALKDVLKLWNKNRTLGSVDTTKRVDAVKITATHILEYTARNDYNRECQLHGLDMIKEERSLTEEEVRQKFEDLHREIPEEQEARTLRDELRKLRKDLYTEPEDVAFRITSLVDEVAPLLVAIQIKKLQNAGRFAEATILIEQRYHREDSIKERFNSTCENALKKYHDMEKIERIHKNALTHLKWYVLMFIASNANQVAANNGQDFQQIANASVRLMTSR